LEGIIIAVFAIFVVCLIILIPRWHRSRINDKIDSIGGTVLSIERRNFFTGIGPFKIVGKGRTVYRIEYKIQDQTKEGWVKFGGIMGADWRL
jgi:hypothetical protein